MKRTTIYLPEKTHRMIRKMSVSSEKPMSRIVIDAVESTYREELKDIADAETALAEYRRNPKSAVDFLEYIKQRPKRLRAS